MRTAFRWLLGVLWALAVARITLTPEGVPEWSSAPGVTYCIICGSRGAADALLNAVLFLPLGLLVGLRWRVRHALLAGLLTSGLIEVCQLYVPGRNPAISDLVWNTVGAAVGGVAAGTLTRWLGGVPPVRARILSVALPGIYLLAAGVLAAPVGTDARYFGQWTPALGFMKHYQGRVVDAEFNGEPLPAAPFDPEDPHPPVSGDLQVSATVVKGPPPEGIAPIVSIYDAQQREILVLGADHEDLVWRLRDRALAARFDFREVRLPSALAGIPVGDTLRLEATRVDGALCIAVDDQRSCGLGFRPEGTWRYLMNLEGASQGFRSFLSWGWMATLFFLVGLLGGSLRSTALGVAASVGTVAAVAALTPLLLPHPLAWSGMAAGVLFGVAARPLARWTLGLSPESGGAVARSLLRSGGPHVRNK